MLAWSQLAQKKTFEKNEVKGRGLFAGCILGSVMVVVFCKKITAFVGNITFYKGNEWACDGDSDSTIHTWLQ